jgi:hypothetical protein
MIIRDGSVIFGGSFKPTPSQDEPSGHCGTVTSAGHCSLLPRNVEVIPLS